jgi:hypothetical protein
MCSIYHQNYLLPYQQKQNLNGLDPTCFPNLPKNQTRNTILAPKFERNFKRRIIEINFKQKQQFFNPTLLICHNSFDICKKKVISS